VDRKAGRVKRIDEKASTGKGEAQQTGRKRPLVPTIIRTKTKEEMWGDVFFQNRRGTAKPKGEKKKNWGRGHYKKTSGTNSKSPSGVKRGGSAKIGRKKRAGKRGGGETQDSNRKCVRHATETGKQKVRWEKIKK